MRLGFSLLALLLVIFVYSNESYANRCRGGRCGVRQFACSGGRCQVMQSGGCANGRCQIPQSVGCANGRCQIQQPFVNGTSLDQVQLNLAQQLGFSNNGFGNGVNLVPGINPGFNGAFDPNGFSGNIGVGSSGGFFPGVGANGVSPFTNGNFSGNPSVNSPVEGGFGGGFQDIGSFIHNRSTGPARKVGNVWVENVNVADPTIRVSTGQQLVIDPGTGQLVSSFPGMLVIDTGQVVNGRRVVFPASRDSVATVLSAYASNPNFGGFAQSILSNYQTNFPGFTQAIFQGFQGGIPGNPGLNVAQTNTGGAPGLTNQGGTNGTTASTDTGAPNPNGIYNPAVGTHSDAAVEPTRPMAETTTEKTRWQKWLEKYEAAAGKVSRDELNTQLASHVKAVAGKSYKAAVIRQQCASKGKPNEIKQMTVILYTSETEGTQKNHAVVQSGYISVDQEANAIVDGWEIAKEASLGELAYKDDSTALVNARTLSDSAKATYPGYEEVQVRIRPFVKDGKLDFVTKQAIKKAEDAKPSTRWKDSENDKNLFCVSEPSAHPTASTDAAASDSSRPATSTPDEFKRTVTKYCFSCHMDDKGNDPQGSDLFTADGDVKDKNPEKLKSIYERIMSQERPMPPAGSRFPDGTNKFESFHSAENESQLDAIKVWLKANMEK